jgi:UDP-N-acetyl-D-glucosamine dehydrogenase
VALAGPAKTQRSIAPDGSEYIVPTEGEIASSFSGIAEAARTHRSQGRQVVAVQGIGFVGAAVCAAVAGATDTEGKPLHYVVGVDLLSPESYWKVAKLNSGLFPFGTPDLVLERVLSEAVHARGNLAATTSEKAFTLADVVIVDVNLDAEDHAVDAASDIRVDLDGFRTAIRAVGRSMRAEALVLVESTVPVGTCEHVVLPILREERSSRGIEAPVLLAHAYERVMPGPNYLESVRAYPRTVAGVDEESTARARTFLSTFIETDTYPLAELRDTVSSELAKLLENSYRAANIAFIHEWTLLAEEIGVNLFDVIDAIRVRKGTHDNMRYPGFGVGGYCLTKDSLLAQWGATHLLGSEEVLATTLNAVKVNYLMPSHTLDLVTEAAGGGLEGTTIAVCGVSYLADVADSRNSPTATLVDAVERAGAEVRLHDPHLRTWPQKPEVSFVEDVRAAVAGADGVVFAVPHRAYLDLSAEELHAYAEDKPFLVDAHNVVSDAKAQFLHEAGWRVLGVGKGHWRKLGYHLRK